jgi:hypothetical protein
MMMLPGHCRRLQHAHGAHPDQLQHVIDEVWPP